MLKKRDIVLLVLRLMRTGMGKMGHRLRHSEHFQNMHPYLLTDYSRFGGLTIPRVHFGLKSNF